jgi:hypothetical protein
MRCLFLRTALVVAVALIATYSRAADDETAASIRCLVVSMALSNSPDQNVKTASVLATIYWFGRLDGAGAPRDLEDQMVDLSARMKPDDIRSEAMRCGEIMRIRGKEMQDMGQRLVERGEALRRQQQNPVVSP